MSSGYATWFYLFFQGIIFISKHASVLRHYYLMADVLIFNHLDNIGLLGIACDWVLLWHQTVHQNPNYTPYTEKFQILFKTLSEIITFAKYFFKHAHYVFNTLKEHFISVVAHMSFCLYIMSSHQKTNIFHNTEISS